MYCLFVLTGLLSVTYGVPFVCILHDYCPWRTVYCLFVLTGLLALNYSVLFVHTYRITVCDLRCIVCLYFTWLLSLTYGVPFDCILQNYCPLVTVFWLRFTGLLALTYGVRYLSARQCVFIGAILAVLSFIFTSLAKNGNILFVSYGLLLGKPSTRSKHIFI